MFARYEYKAGSTPNNILADVAAILTGTTDVDTLSADCVKASSSIIADAARPAGWEMWDAAAVAASGAKCIRALNEDGSTYKYVNLDRTTTGNIYLFLKVYEDWNATTHVGSNLADNATNYVIQLQHLDGGILFISASNKSIAVQGWSSGTWSIPLMVVEHTRDEPWDTPAFGQPCFGYMGSGVLDSSAQPYSYASGAFTKPRRKFPGIADWTAGSAKIAVLGPYISGTVNINLYNTSPIERIRDAAGVGMHAFCQMLLVDGNQISGKLLDIFLTTRGMGQPSDEAIYDGKTYFIMGRAEAGAVRIAVPKF